MNYSWAEDYPEVQRVCTLFSLTDLNSPLRYSYTSYMPFIQEGPHCGLVALAIYMGSPTATSVDALLQSARERAFTNFGEMFSAIDMKKLAYVHTLKTTDVQLHSGILNTGEIKELLLKGNYMLVPYDTDKDNSPCCANGHKAHWALICGAVETETDFYVIARHGKVRNVAIWKLSDLSESNAQMNEAGMDQPPDVYWKMPDEGVGGPFGLKSKSVILRPFNNRKNLL